MNNSKYLLPTVAAIAVVIGIVLGLNLTRSEQTPSSSSKSEIAKKLNDVLQIIEREYVDTVDKQALFEETIMDMLHKLDPHSNYIPASKLKEMTESIQGQFGGVGIRFTILRDTLCVTNVVENSPAYFSGIKKFDQLLLVDGDSIANVGLTNRQVQEKLKGEPGTNVSVTLLRKGELINKTIQRGLVPINSVLAAFMVDETTGYIRLSQFSMNSDKEFFNAAVGLLNKGMKNLIIDLRYNGGGVMSSAVNIADAFLPKGVKIVSTFGKKRGEEIQYSMNAPLFEETGVVVLINQSSASASEIVAGAIQDNDRGIIVGRRSFGKGLVQQDLELIDGSSLRLTTSRYYTPTGRCIQKDYSSGYEDYVMDEYTRYEKGELYKLDSSLFVDSLKYTTPGGRTVYGGGGIMPDVFVPLDTTNSSMYYRKLQYTSAFGDFAFDYVRFNQPKWASLQQFDKEFEVDASLLKKFTDYAAENFSIKPDPKGLNKSLERIKTDIKSEIARQIWLEDGLFYIRNQTDNEFLKALEEVRSIKLPF